MNNAGRTKSQTQLGPLQHDLFFTVRNLHSLLRPHGQRIRESLNIEDGVIGVLNIIWLNPGISQNALAASLAIKKSAVTKLVKSLEANNYITREKVNEDRRMNALTLTSSGHQLVASIRKLTDEFHANLFETIPDSDLDTFFNIADKLFEQINCND